MAEELKDPCPFASSLEDQQAEHREREAVQGGPLSRRFEVGTQAGVCSTSATRGAALRRARKLARTEKVPVVVHDRMAKGGAQHIWLFCEDGLIRAIARRTGNVGRKPPLQ